MTRTITATCVVALLFAGASAGYNNATGVKYDANLECGTCVRAGYDFCLTQTAGATPPLTWTCNQNSIDPEATVGKGSTANGYVCSNAFKDQTNAIINGCRPAINQATTGDHSYCGDYLVDLSGASFGNRQVKTFPVGGSCTWRIFSTCGYPQARLAVFNPLIVGDYDLAWTTQSGIQRDADMDGWNFTYTTEWTGSSSSSAYSNILDLSEALQGNAPKIGSVEFEYCNSTARNMWLTVTRTKNSAPAVAEEAENFFGSQERMLPSPFPNGTVFFDLEIVLSNNQGSNGKILSVMAVVLVAVLSVFAF